MPKQTRTYKAILSEVARGNRSTLFRWLVNHHDDLIEQAAGKPMRWEPLSKRFAEHGLTDINGQPATPSTARATWFQARKAVAEAKKRKKASDAARRPGGVYPLPDITGLAANGGPAAADKGSPSCGRNHLPAAVQRSARAIA